MGQDDKVKAGRKVDFSKIEPEYRAASDYIASSRVFIPSLEAPFLDVA